LPDNTNEGISQAVARACATIQPDVCPRWLLVSWLLWRTAMQICKTHALMEQQRIASVSLLWQELQGLASQTEVTR